MTAGRSRRTPVLVGVSQRIVPARRRNLIIQYGVMSEIERSHMVRGVAPRLWLPSPIEETAPCVEARLPSFRRLSSPRSWARAAAVVAAAVAARPSRQQDAVCRDASSFKSSVNKLVNDVKSGNFGDAKSQAATVKSDFQALESSAKDLASSKKSSVQSDLDSVKGTLDNLTSASSLSDIQSTLGKAQSELKNTANSITNTLSC